MIGKWGKEGEKPERSHYRRRDDQGWIQPEDSDEWWDIYDRHRRLTGRTHRRGTPLGRGERHLVVHVWIRDGAGRFLLTQRAENKSYPLRWETCGGSALAGEDSRTAALREAWEESGLRLDPGAGRVLLSIRRRDYFLDVWGFEQEFAPDRVRLCPGETCGAQAADWAAITALRRQGSFVPYEYMDRLPRIWKR